MMLLFYFLLLTSQVSYAKIIVHMMDSSHSHLKSIMPFIERAQENGHSFHFLESGFSNPYKYPDNITSTYFHITMDPAWKDSFLPLLWTEHWESKNTVNMWEVGDRNFENNYKTDRQKLLNVYNQTWDLVLGDELFTPSANALALKGRREHGTPFIIAATCVMLHTTRYHLALGGTVVTRPSKFIAQGREHQVESFISRLYAVASETLDHYHIDRTVNHVAVQTYKLLNLHHFHLSKVAQQSSYFFADELVPLVWPAPTSTQVIQTGYNCEDVGQLPAQYEEFVRDKRSRGTIFMAFGSNVDWNYSPKHLLKELVDGFNQLSEYRVIFTFNGNVSLVTDLKSHVLITKWAPQKEILHHNNTKLFISHGGLKSLKDAICGTVPLIIIPLFAEQPLSGEFVRHAGIGDLLLKLDITAENFSRKVRSIAEKADNKKNIMMLKRFFLDRPIDNLEMASFAFRRAIKLGERYPTFKIKGMFQSLLTHLYILHLLVLIAFYAVIV